MSKLEVGKGTAYLYIENIVAMLYGYAFWFILTKITSADVIGISSSLISLATILVSVSSIGIPIGVGRFLGKLFFERKFEEAKVFVESSLLIVSTGIVICSILLLVTQKWLLTNFDYSLITVCVILISASAISVLFRSIVIASLSTRRLLIVSTISSAVKIVVTIILILIGAGALGITLGFAVAPILLAFFLIFNIMTILRQARNEYIFSFKHTFRNLLSASVPSWIPFVIDTIGAQLGTIVILGSQGPSQAGFYFIAFQIVIGISAVIWALESTTYPALSAMRDGRKRFLWRVIKFGLIIVLPISSSVFFYSKEVMQLFGDSYGSASFALQVLLISIVPTSISAGIGILTYSYGNYRHVLLLGLATSIPRCVLYFIFIPWYGLTGAALSYTLGSALGFIVSIAISKRIGIIIFWKDIALMTIIPTVFAFILSYSRTYYLVGLLVSIIITYLLFLKFHVVTREDVQDSLGILPGNLATPIIRVVDKIGRKLTSKY